MSEETHRRGLRVAVTGQFFGMLGMSSFGNGLLLLYMSVMGFDPVRIIAYLAIPNTISTIFRLPIAFLADRYGKKRFGIAGVSLVTLGFLIVPFAGSLKQEVAEIAIVAGFCLLATGKTLFACSWMSLLSPMVEEEERGRVFGNMRIAYQIGGILFAGICSYVLTRDAPAHYFQIICAVLALCFLLRVVFYIQIPEVENTAPPATVTFFHAFGEILRTEGLVSFCSYVFLLTLFTAGCPNLFALIEKNVLMLTSGQVMLLANIAMIGALLGHYLGGRAVDRWGTKPVFLVAHAGFGICLAAFILRGLFLDNVVIVLGIVQFCFGLVGASSGMAISTEMLALAPKACKSLAISMCVSMVLGGSALAGLASAWILDIGMLKESWNGWGMTLSNYDALLIGSCIMIVLMVVTLGLVPSILRRAEWIPRGQP